ncbi:hypothetical protein FHU41_002647 [Psychromicrobium silvestre]|uniref:Uncharacterized protein n=1 Tax=Psychromicrobium silvestre TaxID=1645614 RepID=A0A7Y9S9K5_9MICC|nr:hypothetical protein [Psychromicrobium silvestre]
MTRQWAIPKSTDYREAGRRNDVADPTGVAKEKLRHTEAFG